MIDARPLLALAYATALSLGLVPAAAPAESSTLIAFQSNRDGTYQVYVLNAATKAQTQLTFSRRSQGQNFDPAWAPSGRQLVFESDRHSNTSSDIYRMSYPVSVSRAPPRLTANQVPDLNPAWSRDGTIAFQSNRRGNYEIYRMRAKDGSLLKQLTANPAQDSDPAWSPQGTKIAFDTNRDGNFEIYVMNADGTGLQRLTTNKARDVNPAWSPDGGTIAFESDRTGNNEIFRMSAKFPLGGSRQVALTSNPARESDPTWSPDGKSIAFVSDRDGNSEIYVMSLAAPAKPTRMTNNPAVDLVPNWQLPP